MCHEARAIVMETYDRVPNVVWQLSYPTDHKPVAFVYIDYNIDTVYVEALTGANRHIWPSIGKVQYLAYELQQPRAFKEWDMLKSDCPMLKDLTFILPGLILDSSMMRRGGSLMLPPISA